MYSNVPFAELIPTRDPDLKQECILALLQFGPRTEAAALATISTAIEQHRWIQRRDRERTTPILDEISATDELIEWSWADEGFVADLLEHLSPADAEVLRLRYLSDLSAAEVAKALGITQPTMRKRLDAAVTAAREIAQRDFHFEDSPPLK